MTRHYNFICYLVLVVVFITSSCKKPQYKRYEEDPDFSDQPPHVRARGTWLVDDFTFNSKSVVNKYNSIFGGKIDVRNSSVTVNFDEIDKEETVHFDSPKRSTMGCVFDETSFIITPDWANDSATTMEFYSPLHFNVPLQPSIHWRVTKLFKNEMNIVFSTDTGEYKLFLSK